MVALGRVHLRPHWGKLSRVALAFAAGRRVDAVTNGHTHYELVFGGDVRSPPGALIVNENEIELTAEAAYAQCFGDQLSGLCAGERAAEQAIATFPIGVEHAYHSYTCRFCRGDYLSAFVPVNTKCLFTIRMFYSSDSLPRLSLGPSQDRHKQPALIQRNRSTLWHIVARSAHIKPFPQLQWPTLIYSSITKRLNLVLGSRYSLSDSETR